MVLVPRLAKAVPLVAAFVPAEGVPTTVRPRALVYSVQPVGQALANRAISLAKTSFPSSNSLVVKFMLPTTSSALAGVVVPMPTFPVFKTVKICVEVPMLNNALGGKVVVAIFKLVLIVEVPIAKTPVLEA